MEGVIGYVTMFAGNFAPKSWAFCQGQIIAISSNTALFSILGTTYGGNGTTTFALPDCQGRYVVGAGSGPGLSPYALGQKGGSENITLSVNQMPAHVHALAITATPKGYNDAGSLESPDAANYALNGSGYAPAGGNAMKSYTAQVQMSNTGADYPFEILSPFMGLNYIICQYGVFPARN